MTTFQLIGIADENRQRPSESTLLALLSGGLDYFYDRSAAAETSLKSSTNARSRTLLAAPNPGEVRAPFRWHLKEADRLRLFGNEEPLSEKPFSTSIHQLNDWPTLAGQVELVFYSPIFPSISKPGYGPTVQLGRLAQQIKLIREQHGHRALPRLIGLGGISANNVRLVHQAGFDGAALMGALWQSPNPVAALQQIRASIYT
ncbi:thiamine phosphate synthase [Spirosoma sp. RP8]|uniref:Thiamine phosphate synthase n=1 Tax=Spirosoma liriopis TaxID=2937440 RepID=A0ABT0HSV4_9BACT|nr:thiamine phosphate synthase [Spirosoma liriopis]MCK8495055.1 thiamine phosphate synthase [Spirosoma liriopis]